MVWSIKPYFLNIPVGHLRVGERHRFGEPRRGHSDGSDRANCGQHRHPYGSVDRVARVLKQSRPNLWPRSGRGGGSKAAHVEPSHLVNLALGLAVADPITTAPQIVSGYRELTLWDALYMRPECLEDPITEALFHQTGCPITPEGWVLVDGILSGTLGSACERLIELLASPAEKPLRDRLRIYGLQLELIVDRTPSASIVYRTIGGEEMHFCTCCARLGFPYPTTSYRRRLSPL